MGIKELTKKAKEVKEKLRQTSKKRWKVGQYLDGFVGDVGGLVKSMMAKNGFREMDDVDKKIAHNLSDCLYSILVIADELKIDLEKEFVKNMNELGKKIKSAKNYE